MGPDSPIVIKPNPENCKNGSSKCAYDCAQLQYTIQHRTVLIISPLTSKHHSTYVLYRRRGVLKIKLTTNQQPKPTPNPEHPSSGFTLYFVLKFKYLQGPWSCIFKDQFSTEVYSMESITAIFNIYFCDYGTVLVHKNKTRQLLANLVLDKISV